MPHLSRSRIQELDAADPLAHARDRFALPEGVVYLDGNSLGAMPKAAAARVTKTVEEEWATGLIRSWNTADWIDLPRTVGDKIATLIGEIQDETDKTVSVVEEGAKRTADGVLVVDQAREAFEQIGVQVDQVSRQIAEIVNATAEIAVVAEHSSAATEQVSASTEQTSASAEEIAASAEELAATAQELQSLVASFKVAA